MADQQTRGQQQQQMQQAQPTEAIKSLLPQQGPSKSQVLAVVTLFPVGGALLFLAGLTLVGTLIGLAVATPVFLLFSPVLVPAALTIALAVTGFLTSGAFGITALSSLSWMINYMRRMRGTAGEQMEHAKRRVQETAGQMGQKAGQKIQETQRTL
ncbi:Oleosin 5 [Capsicum baccatum]|uniref:Oleosin n=1 Tax=Capsicum baccatum TaxID=33114 RepID=A0A2G2X8T5_CAPBA|nr:Oleosin 5 [Capsicum baccatum]